MVLFRTIVAINVGVMAWFFAILVVPPSNAAEAPKNLQNLIEAAKKEGQVVYATSGETPETIQKLGQAFNKKFGLDIQLEGVPLQASGAVTRILQEKAANRLTLDLAHPSYPLVQRLLGKGILAEFDWVGVFGEKLPAIKEAATHVPPYLKNKVLDYQHLVYVGLYNTKALTKNEVPKKWNDLLQPRWRGRKIVLDPRGTSLYLLFLEYGEKWVLDFASKLVEQEPLFVSGSPNIAKAVAKGEAPLGITGFSNILEQKKLGQPVELAPFEVAGVVPQVIVPLEGGPHPAAAKLFAAWFATDGMLMLQDVDGTGRAWPGTDWLMAKELEKARVKLVFASTPEQIESATNVITKVSKIMRQRR